MRVRSHRVQQATGYPGTAAVAMVVTMVMTVLRVVTVRMVVTVLMILVRAARAVHVDQHARENALPHINTYQGRALAN
jgi:hypothetical protein